MPGSTSRHDDAAAQLQHVAPHPAHRKVRRDVVWMLLRTRQFRLAVATAFLPVGYAISKYEPTQGGKHVGMVRGALD